MLGPPVALSICIPSYNRAAKLGRLLSSIETAISASAHDNASAAPDDLRSADPRFDDPRSADLRFDDIEVVVVLDGSSDDSAAMLDRRAANSPLRLRHVWQENAGLAAARNRAITEAAGEVIWLLDDDMEITPTAARAHRNWPRNEVPILSGPSFVVGSEGLAQFYEARWDELRSLGAITEPNQVSFANTSAPRALMLEHRFDDSFVGYGFEDYELAIRIFDAGVRMGYDHDASVTHFYDRTHRQMLGNIREEGTNRVRVAELHPQAGSFAMELDPCELQGAADWLMKREQSTVLWLAAHASWYLKRLFPHKPHGQFRLDELSKALAVRSGVARGLATSSGDQTPVSS